MSQPINPMTRDRSASSFSQENSFNSDIDSFLDFEQQTPYLSPSALTRSSSSAASSAQNTPHMSQAQPVQTEFSAPSHQYDLHPQQTLAYDMISGSDLFMNLDDNSNSSINGQNGSLPAFFYPESSSATSDPMVQGISPMMTVDPVKTEPVAPIPARSQPRYYSGIHTEMAAYNENLKALEAQKLAQQQKMNMQQRPTTVQDRITGILNSMKPSGPSAAITSKTANVLPHIAKLKKEEDEMDEDERLLASEEGKKLSSKERRQLRNKVSARAFRSRRKEYIGQLEAEVNGKTRENIELQHANDMLRQENEKLQELTRLLLGSQQFSAFLDAMHPVENAPAPAPVSQAPVQNVSQASMPTNIEAMPRFTTDRDRNPAIAPADEWPLAYGNGWSAPQVFNVEIPEPPSIQDLTGKVSEDDILPVSDGFFPRRSEKGDIMNFEPLPLDEEIYEAPENIMDLYEDDDYFFEAPEEEEEPQEKKSLDELFPGTGVNTLLARLEMIAGGEAKPEDFFDVEPSEEVKEDAVEVATPEIRPSACETNRILQEAESVYQRIGMTVGGRN